MELKTKATKQFQADLKKYAGYTGVPDFGIYTGYITCDMAILGLQNAGNPPTRAAFAPNLRKLGTYDQAGLACQPDRHQHRDLRPGGAHGLRLVRAGQERQVRALPREREAMDGKLDRGVDRAPHHHDMIAITLDGERASGPAAAGRPRCVVPIVVLTSTASRCSTGTPARWRTSTTPRRPRPARRAGG